VEKNSKGRFPPSPEGDSLQRSFSLKANAAATTVSVKLPINA
jgi:hypothetical protein